MDTNYHVLVIDNRVRLYQGKTQVSFEECGTHAIALDVAVKLQKEHNATQAVYGPQVSEEKRRHQNYVAKRNSEEKEAKKEAKKVKKTKDQIDKEVAELKKKLALLGD